MKRIVKYDVSTEENTQQVPRGHGAELTPQPGESSSVDTLGKEAFRRKPHSAPHRLGGLKVRSGGGCGNLRRWKQTLHHA